MNTIAQAGPAWVQPTVGSTYDIALSWRYFTTQKSYLNYNLIFTTCNNDFGQFLVNIPFYKWAERS